MPRLQVLCDEPCESIRQRILRFDIFHNKRICYVKEGIYENKNRTVSYRNRIATFAPVLPPARLTACRCSTKMLILITGLTLHRTGHRGDVLMKVHSGAYFIALIVLICTVDYYIKCSVD